jgi:hypothetical protein
MAIELHPGQSEVYEDMFINNVMKYGVVCCSRGWGKSYEAGVAATTAIFELMELAPWVPHKTVYVIAPTYDQVTEIYYPLLAYELGLEAYAIKSSMSEGRFIFENNIELRLISYESIERMRGKGAYFVVWDEVSSCKKGLNPKEAWQSIIQPCIVTRWSPERAKAYGSKHSGRALMISTPKGYNFFYELFNKQDKNDDWKSYHFDYHSSPYLDVNEIKKIQQDIDPIEFASEYLASFEDSGNNVFYMFSRKDHVNREIEDFFLPEDGQQGEVVHAAIDFNVGIQATTLFAVRGNKIEIIDQMKGHPDTETLAIALSTKYKGHKIIAYPDPSGRARKTSAAVGVTDFNILEHYGIRCLAHNKAPPIIDSVQAVNAKLKNAAGTISITVHPRCEGVIQSLERTKWVDSNPDTATIDKKEGIEHFSDGIRYAVEYLYPVRNSKKRAARGFSF